MLFSNLLFYRLRVLEINHDQKGKNKSYFVLETTQPKIFFSSKAAAIFAYKSKNTTIAARVAAVKVS